jgi:hypothetical protein
MAILRPPNVANGWSRLTAEAQNEIMAGALAIRRIREHEDYHHWTQVGRALLRLQEEALHLSGSNSPHGRGYTAIRAELGSRVPDLEELDKTSKAHATWLAKNFAAVEQWRSTLAANQRDRLNHPSVIKRRFEATHGEMKAASPTAEKPVSLVERVKAENVRLQEELDAADAKIRRLERAEGDMLLISRKDPPEQILAVLESEVPTKTGRIAAILLNRQKGTAPRPRRARVAALEEKA